MKGYELIGVNKNRKTLLFRHSKYMDARELKCEDSECLENAEKILNYK